MSNHKVEEMNIFDQLKDNNGPIKLEASLKDDLAGRKPFLIRFRGVVYHGSNWNEVFPWLASRIISMGKISDKELIEDNYFRGSTRYYFSDNYETMWMPHKVSDTIWMETNLSANAFRDIAQHLLEKVGIPPDEVRIKLRR